MSWKARKLFLISLILTSSTLFHPSLGASNVQDERILEMKVKAITSLELKSMTFNELPNLFSLYRNFVNKRFELLNGREEELETFHNIHQFYAFEHDFRVWQKFRDVIMNKYVDINSLEIYSKKVNWTDSQIAKWQFLVKDEKGNFKFRDPDLANYFMAEYFFDKLFKPNDHPSDDEMDLRIRLLLHFMTDPYDKNFILEEFIKSMVEDVEEPVFNDQIRMIMKYRFAYLLDNVPADKASKIFEKDEEILGNLWGIDKEQPYYLRSFRTTSSVDEVFKLRDVALEYFDVGTNGSPEKSSTGSSIDSTTENSQKTKAKPFAPNIFKGRNQLLNIMYWINRHRDENFTSNLLEVTETSVNPNILAQLKNTSNFLDFVDSGDFTRDEKREFYLANSYELISNSRDGSSLMSLWARLRKYFSSTELKGILTKKEIDYNSTHLFLLPSHSDHSFVQSFLDLTRRYLTHDEIRGLINERRPLTRESFIVNYLRIVQDIKNLEICWNFTKDYLNHDEQRDFLFNNTDSTFLQKIINQPSVFKFGMEILKEFYSLDEIREMFMEVDGTDNRTILFTIASFGNMNVRAVQAVVDYMRVIFKDRLDMLRDLYRKKGSFDLTVLGYYKQDYYQKSVEPVKELAKEIFNDEEYEELIKVHDSK